MARQRIEPRLAAALWIGLIYTTVPFIRTAREAFVARWPAESIAYAVIAIVLSATVAAIVILRKRQPRIGRVDLLWLAGLAAVCVVWTYHLMGQPEEAVHFLEYGILGVLLYRAFEDRVPAPTIYLAVILIGLLAGTVDEIIQWLVPGRFWDIRDIILNASAVALTQIAIWRLCKRPSGTPSWSSLRLVFRIAAAQVLLFTLCMAATPQRLHRIANTVPLPERLTTGIDTICEYGFLHSVDDRTHFRSRLATADLLQSDRDRAPVLARDLDALRGNRGLAQSSVSPASDPFLFEMRIHIFARNRSFHNALSREPGSSSHRRHMTTAWRENLIIERSFGNTLEQSSYRWGPRRRDMALAAHDSDLVFVSRAGAHLITKITEVQLRTLLLALFGALVACDVFFSTRFRPGSPSA